MLAKDQICHFSPQNKCENKTWLQIVHKRIYIYAHNVWSKYNCISTYVELAVISLESDNSDDISVSESMLKPDIHLELVLKA